ncbi:GNAT family N-acetyltransferase [Nitratireductor sp. XY-223]|uniref:GNAT family N-acetyltransferase n=1 Tax=Nitratireductor sp. XY-223 TaxID=2561926 RepID=UPI0010AA682F|nr:GNAT family N-acetyltransferase [Nitratireductor sp. XY-223]
MPLPHERPTDSAVAKGIAGQLAAVVPVIETERLRLRAPAIGDFQAYAEIVESAAGRFLLDEPDREGAWHDFAQMTATWMLQGHGVWTVENKRTEELLGFVLIGMEPGDHEPELGYMFREGAQGRGFATEAARAAKAYAFETLQLETLVSTIDKENARSCALAERLGGVRDKKAEAAHGNAILVYRYRHETG